MVAEPGGHVAICPTGNPGMASAGMGDVLTGVISGLLAQGLGGCDAATAGVDASAVADVSGLVVTPGLIDGRVRFGEPGFEHRETIRSGLDAAAAGGFTAVVLFGDTEPVNDDRATIELLVAEAARQSRTRLHPVAAVTRRRAGEELTEAGEMLAAGAVALSDAERPITNAALLRRALLYARHFDVPIVHHACNPDLDDEGVMHEGEWSTRLGLPGSPALAEDVMVARDLLLVAETGGRYHLGPVSTANSLEQIRRAKGRGDAVSCDVTPHHLLLTDQTVADSGFSTATRVVPPLRPALDVEALHEGLADGTVDAIVSDHWPHHADDKEDVQLSVAPPDIVGLETTVSLCLDRLVHGGVIDLVRLVELLSTGPARLFGLAGGSLEVGRPADITLLDLERQVNVDPSRFHSLGRSTPFAGWSLRGAAVGTLVGGEPVEIS